jgi:hypothetical protein
MLGLFFGGGINPDAEASACKRSTTATPLLHLIDNMVVALEKVRVWTADQYIMRGWSSTGAEDIQLGFITARPWLGINIIKYYGTHNYSYVQ